jgi:predicted nuclease of predicted toxin-antitoxin system
MRLLAVENVDAAVVDWLRSQGVEVAYVAELAPASCDDDVLRMARDEDRILLTADLDFGEMVFRQRQLTNGVVLLRYRAPSQGERLEIFRAHWARIATRVEGKFVVATDRKVRIRPLPPPNPGRS